MILIKGKRVSRHQLCGWLEVEEGQKQTAGLSLLPKYGALSYATVQKAAKKLGDDAEVKPGTKQKKTSYLTNVRLLGKLVLWFLFSCNSCLCRNNGVGMDR